MKTRVSLKGCAYNCSSLLKVGSSKKEALKNLVFWMFFIDNMEQNCLEGMSLNIRDYAIIKVVQATTTKEILDMVRLGLHNAHACPLSQ